MAEPCPRLPATSHYVLQSCSTKLTPDNADELKILAESEASKFLTYLSHPDIIVVTDSWKNKKSSRTVSNHQNESTF